MTMNLYPMTKLPGALERLADVPKGTHERLMALREALLLVYPDETGGDVTGDPETKPSYLRHQALQRHPNEAKLDQFLAFGWGSVVFPLALQGLAEASAELSGGSSTNLVECSMLFKAKGITGDDLWLAQGLYWY